MADEPLFTTLDASKLEAGLVRLLCRTAREHGRVEITNCDGSSCVMISKDELDSLERALEILANTEAGHTLRQAVEQFAAITAGSSPPAA